MNTDFLIGQDEHGQRFAYPVSERGRTYFDANIGHFDVSDEGWELDTTKAAYAEFTSSMAHADLSYRSAA